MEIIKRKSGLRFREKVYLEDGRSVTKTFISKTYAKNWKIQKTREVQLQKASGNKLQRIDNVSIFFDLWLERKKAGELEPKTISSYQSAIKVYLKPFFGLKKIENIRINDGEEFKLFLKRKNLSNGRISLILKVLKMVFSDAYKWEFLVNNPFSNLINVRKEIKSKVFWTLQEVNQFLTANYHSENYDLYVVALNTGMRISELFGLCWDCVDFEGKTITIRRQLEKGLLKPYTKGKRNRVIEMNETAKSSLLRLKNENRHNQLVFTTKDGSPYDSSHFCNRSFNQALLLSSVKKIRFHDLRTTFACNWCIAGNDIFALSKVLGHSSVKITEDHYADFHPNSAKKMNGFEIKAYSPYLAHENVVQL